eukprot:UN04357
MPEGLIMIENFISKEEEKAMVNKINSFEWDTELTRRVQHFGYKFDYDARGCNKDKQSG